MKKLVLICFLFYGSGAIAQLQFKSGKAGFNNFLLENLIYPSFSKSNCIQGTVNVRFKLDREGKVSAARVTKSILTELDEEALRLVRMSSGKWLVPSGYDTTTAVIVPVGFRLSGYGCEGKSNSAIQDAIRSYQAEEGLINTVINFYKNIDQAKPGQEVQIISIKRQLGIDTDYLQDKIDNGLKKIKQGDQEGACQDFLFVKHMGSDMADTYLAKYCNQ